MEEARRAEAGGGVVGTFRERIFRRYLWDVRSFHAVGGVPIAEAPAPLSAERAAFRAGLLTEEWEETKQALSADDVVEAADGLIDMIYIAAGTAVECGVDLRPQDLSASGGDFDRFLQAPLLDRMPSVRIPAKGPLVDFMRWTVGAANSIIAKGDPAAISAGLSRVVETALLMGGLCNIPTFEIWKEIHRSNMAKVDPATGAVVRREDGKILKPEGWTRPDVAGVMEMYRKNVACTDVLDDAARNLAKAFVEASDSSTFVRRPLFNRGSKMIGETIRSYLDVMALTAFCYEPYAEDANRMDDLLAAMKDTVGLARDAEASFAGEYCNTPNSFTFSALSASLISLSRLERLHSDMQQP